MYFFFVLFLFSVINVRWFCPRLSKWVHSARKKHLCCQSSTWWTESSADDSKYRRKIPLRQGQLCGMEKGFSKKSLEGVYTAEMTRGRIFLWVFKPPVCGKRKTRDFHVVDMAQVVFSGISVQKLVRGSGTIGQAVRWSLVELNLVPQCKVHSFLHIYLHSISYFTHFLSSLDLLVSPHGSSQRLHPLCLAAVSFATTCRPLGFRSVAESLPRFTSFLYVSLRLNCLLSLIREKVAASLSFLM